MSPPGSPAALVHTDLDATIARNLSQDVDTGEPGQTISVDRQSQTRRLTRSSPAAVRRLGYTEGRELGRGGLGVVIEATQQAFDRPVAIKRLLSTGDRVQAMSFYAEALIAAQLEHPNIVPIHDLLADSAGNLALVMKRVDGRSWKSLLAEGTTPAEQHLEILLKVCEAVEFAHSRGILHRDLKPENVMIGDFGEVSVMDWGCALAFGEHEHHPVVPRVEEADTIAGTPAYMAPEMVLLNPNRLGPASDVFLLAAILYETLTGTRVHVGSTVMEVLRAAALGEIQPPQVRAPDRLIPDELVAITMAGLHPDPAQRTASAAALATSLRAYRQHAQAVTLAGHARSLLASLKGIPANRADEVLQRAVAASENACQLWPGWPAGRQLLAQATLNWARHCLATGGHTQAQALALQAVEAARSAANRKLGDEALQVVERARAAAQSARARERHLRITRIAALAAVVLVALVALIGYFRVRTEHQQTERALADSERARATLVAEQDARRRDQRRFAPALVTQARTALSAGRLEEGSVDLAAALSFDPQQRDAVLVDAYVLAALGRHAESRRAITTWLEQGGDRSQTAELAELCRLAPLLDPKVLSTRLADLFVRQRMPWLVAGTLASGPQRLAAYRQRIDQVWPGMGQDLEMDEEGRVRFPWNKGFRGRADVLDITVLAGIPFSDLSLNGTKVADLRPLAGMPLRTLDICQTPVTDLAPLRDCPLVELRADGCSQLHFDASLVPQLSVLYLNNTGTRDLTSLRSLPLATLLLANVQTGDLSPLAGKALRSADLGYGVPDLAPLKGCPLEDLSANGSFTDLAPVLNPHLRSLTISSSEPVRVGSLGALEHLGLYHIRFADPEHLSAVRPRTLLLGGYDRMPDLRAMDGTELTSLTLDRVNGFDPALLPHGTRLTGVDAGYSGGSEDFSGLAGQPLTSLTIRDLSSVGWRSLAALRTSPLEHITVNQVSYGAATFWARYHPDLPNHLRLESAQASGTPHPAMSSSAVPRHPGLACEVIPGIEHSVDEMKDHAASATLTLETPSLAPLEAKAHNMGLRFQGVLTVPTTGTYAFHLTSDDGSRLLIDDQVVVENDGQHAVLVQNGSIALAAGAHQVGLLYFQAGGDQVLSLEVEPPGQAQEPVPSSWWSH